MSECPQDYHRKHRLASEVKISGKQTHQGRLAFQN